MEEEHVIESTPYDHLLLSSISSGVTEDSSAVFVYNHISSRFGILLASICTRGPVSAYVHSTITYIHVYKLITNSK